MGEFEEKLNSILSSPKDMKKIMDLARSISSSSDEVPESEPKNEPQKESGGLDFDPNVIKMVTKLMGEYSRESSDSKETLLMSIKPFLKDSRKETVDSAINILKLSKIAKIAFSEFGGGPNI